MLEKLACNLGRNDEGPNIELALSLIEAKDRKGVGEIAGGLESCSEKIVNDCIKVLYEIGEREPRLISGHVQAFLDSLDSRNNRLVWGAMTALAAIASLKRREIYERLDLVLWAFERGSVITVDNAVSVLAELVKGGPEYEKRVFPLLLGHLASCRPKEVPRHSERAFVCVRQGNAGAFKEILLKRRHVLTPPQKKRIDRLLKRIDGGDFHG
jgi:hypothetical protein